MTMRFLAGRTKLANMTCDITIDTTKLNYFHFLFEAKDISMTTRTLGSDDRSIVVESHYSWTPLDYYVTGHAVSHSNCSWSLNFWSTSIDDEKFELFCQGCTAPGELDAGDTSHVLTSCSFQFQWPHLQKHTVICKHHPTHPTEHERATPECQQTGWECM